MCTRIFFLQSLVVIASIQAIPSAQNTAPEITVDSILNYQTNYFFSSEEKLGDYKSFLQKQHIQMIAHPSKIECLKPQVSDFMNPQAMADLGLEKLAQSIPTFTNLGSWGLAYLLFNPITDITCWNNRHSALKFLADHKDIASAITTHLKTINHQSLINYWQTNELHTHVQKLYFSQFFNKSLLKTLHLRNKSLNKNHVALDISNNFVILHALKRLITNFALSGVTSEIASAGLHARAPQVNLNTIAQGFTYPFRIHSFQPAIFKDSMDVDVYPLIEQSKLSGGDWFLYFKYKLQGTANPAAITMAALGLAGITIGAYDAGQAMELYKAYQDIALTYATSNKLHAELINIAHSLRALRLLVSYMQEYPELLHTPGYQELHQILITREQNSDKLNQLLDLLNTDTFRKEGGLYSKGKVLVAHKLLKSIKYEFIPLLQAFATIDASLSIVQLHQISQQNDNKWSFPEVNANSMAYLNLKDFWNPLLDPLNTVSNDINLGQNNGRNAIFSGPNGGGKSTTMQSIALSILLAQSWGIIPAQQGSLSLFNHMFTYLAPQADLTTGSSTFMAEKARLEHIMGQLRTLPAHQNMFIMLDEPLRGTIEREAANRIFLTGLELADYQNCCSVIATHIEKPTQLSLSTPEFVNYQMELLIEDDTFKRTFKLLPGAATWWFNDDIQRSRFIDNLN